MLREVENACDVQECLHSYRLLKSAILLDTVHQIATVCVFHDKVKPILREKEGNS